MFDVSDKSRSSSASQASGQDGSFRSGFETNIIQKANSVSLLKILNDYGCNIDEYTKKIKCPFYFHKGGLERSSSFYYYKETNSFFCFGCNHGGGCVDFVMLYLDIDKKQAATKILDEYNDFSYSDNIVKDFNLRFSKTLEISRIMRDFISKNKEDKNSIAYVEKIMKEYDYVFNKHNLNIKAYSVILNDFVKKIGLYKCQ